MKESFKEKLNRLIVRFFLDMEQFLISNEWMLSAIATLIAFITVWLIHPQLVKLALLKNIVDAPDYRKLQRTPIPVLGGVAVFFGISIGLGITSPFYNCTSLFIIFTVMNVMLYIGTLDDMIGLSASLRLIVETFSVLAFIFLNQISINDFHGLWGIGLIPEWIAIPLTVFISVGIINSINLIDGVNGLSSGFCLISLSVFGYTAYYVADLPLMVLAAVCVGALIPFFLHNIFGNTSRMFIGDGGTLVMGMVMSIFVIHILNSHSSSSYSALPEQNMGLVPFTVAVLAIPVFDTLRVMSARICRRRSPFSPDRTHLHHLFIDIGFSHPGTTLCVLSLNTLIILAWFLVWKLGMSVNIQLYIVILLGILFTFGLYPFVKSLSDQSVFYRFLRVLAVYSHIERKGVFLWIQKMLDKA